MHRTALRAAAFAAASAVAVSCLGLPTAHAGTSEPAPAQPTDGTTVTIKAWNLYQLPAPVSWVYPGRYDRARQAIDEIRSSGADVLALSEVNGEAGRLILEGLKQEYPYRTTRLGESCDGVYGACNELAAGGGIAVLSKYPIVQSEQYVFSSYSALSPETLSNKGVVLARVDKGGQQFWVAATHLQADDALDNAASQTHRVRMAQAAEIRRLIETVVPEGAPVVYGGDFNVEYVAGEHRTDAQGRSEFAQLAANSGVRFHDPAALPLTYDQRSNPLVLKRGYRDTLDYVGTTGGAELRDVTVPNATGGSPASDHYALLGTTFIPTYQGPMVRTDTDLRRLNPTWTDRAIYFVTDLAGTVVRIVVGAVESAYEAVSSVFRPSRPAPADDGVVEDIPAGTTAPTPVSDTSLDFELDPELEPEPDSVPDSELSPESLLASTPQSPSADDGRRTSTADDTASSVDTVSGTGDSDPGDDPVEAPSADEHTEPVEAASAR